MNEEEESRITNLTDEIKTAVKQLKLLNDEWFDKHVGSSSVADYGLCGTCQNIVYAMTKLKARTVRCNDMKLRLSSADPIVECSSYERVGMLSLREMASLAIIIEPKTPVGFRKNGEG